MFSFLEYILKYIQLAMKLGMQGKLQFGALATWQSMATPKATFPLDFLSFHSDCQRLNDQKANLVSGNAKESTFSIGNFLFTKDISISSERTILFIILHSVPVCNIVLLYGEKVVCTSANHLDMGYKYLNT